MDDLKRCMGCGKWTNFGLNCVSCSPQPLDSVPSREEEADTYYEEYLPIAPNFESDEYDDDERSLD